MDNVKINLESHQKSLKINRSLQLIESVNFFFSFLNIDFIKENFELFNKILLFKYIYRRVTAVR